MILAIVGRHGRESNEPAVAVFGDIMPVGVEPVSHAVEACLNPVRRARVLVARARECLFREGGGGSMSLTQRLPLQYFQIVVAVVQRFQLHGESLVPLHFGEDRTPKPAQAEQLDPAPDVRSLLRRVARSVDSPLIGLGRLGVQPVTREVLGATHHRHEGAVDLAARLPMPRTFPEQCG